MIIENEFLDLDDLLLDTFHYFPCQFQTEMSEFIKPVASLNFYRHLVPLVRQTWPKFFSGGYRKHTYYFFRPHMIIENEFLDLDDLLLDTFHYFPCQFQTEMSEFIKPVASLNFYRHLVPLVRQTWPSF